MGLRPRTARVVKDGVEQEVSVEQLSPGDLIRVRPGERIPVDGVVERGKLRGGREHAHRRKPAGREARRLDGDGRDTQHFGQLRLPRNPGRPRHGTRPNRSPGRGGSGWKAPLQRLADTVSSYFVPGVLALSVLTFAGWLLIGPEPRLTLALQAAIAVAVIACPCALGLAALSPSWLGTGKAAENGVLVRGAEALEQARRIDTVVLDKTGTLTRGKPSVTEVIPIDGGYGLELLRYAAAAEAMSEHPLAAAILARAKQEGIEWPAGSNFLSSGGRGVEVDVDGSRILLGNRAFMTNQGSMRLKRRDRRQRRLVRARRLSTSLATVGYWE